ncbi:MAG TPA: serine/threonine-protein kinase [Polyangiaceae bacterium LLY-WYZ-15_(1-7)]|nr:hypothetical protein [Sandaracinus sp.]HJL04594.1 serine/threonine-protein kinase [Polyangiaceae bacterium LLY-WYZ-15_(1-7)]HJL07376.1 serine/threonine-protein kinase [Polyangiaceae bacterium LLY-WYZ-15_(1-7)]HJL25010.1 serine/threonine-protein kinase [Polyangiaceae bacterium LLY-WYZ-15_(1-7)]HJL38891.1 serine/threonine-protein kinase [Polyangiaceae bacterium LLY-WYZ-15_(1-7)]
MRELPPPPEPHSRFGRFEIVDRIAVGGMAEVFRALEPRDVGAPRIVVLKRMLPHVAAEAAGLAMFEEEARLAGQVDHPNVVTLLGSGEAAEQPYLALEYVPGCDLWKLTRWLTRQGKTLGPELACFIVRELLAGLAAVHEAQGPDGEPLGIVHQDVSPSNVLLSIHGDVKLGDFGIAKAKIRNALPGVSMRAKGKLGYLAPEQVTGGAAGRSADVFAAGVIAAELLLGRPLFAGGSELAILLAIRDANIQPFLDLPLPDDLRDAVAAALAKEPETRPESAVAFAERLAPFVPEPVSALKRELAGLVQAASGIDVADQLTPVVESVSEELQRPGTPVTADLPSQTYVVHAEGGGELGPFSFAELVEAITTGRVGAGDRVAIDGGAPQAVRDQPALLRHLPMSTFTPITRDARLATEPDARRNFGGGGFVRALAESALREDSGLWLCSRGGVRKEVYVEKGQPQFVSSNLAGEMLGEMLVAQGVISRGELDMALAVLPRFDGRLGDTLVGLQLVEAVELFRHIAHQVREKLLELFQWEVGTAELYRGVPAPPSGFPLDLDVWSILDEGLGRRLAAGLEDARFRSRLLDPLERVPQLPSYATVEALPEPVQDLLAAAATPTSLAELAERFASDADPQRGYRVSLLALQLGLVRWAA